MLMLLDEKLQQAATTWKTNNLARESKSNKFSKLRGIVTLTTRRIQKLRPITDWVAFFDEAQYTGHHSCVMRRPNYGEITTLHLDLLEALGNAIA
jgi:hypothetical protein